MLGSIFSGGVMHICCDCKTVYVGLTQSKLDCVFMVKTEHVTHCSNVMFSIVFGQQWSKYQNTWQNL